MPTYSYACKTCKHTFDVQQSLSEDSLTVCPKCQGELRKVFGQVGFKGSGFYVNDSGSSSGSKKKSD
jgi:putative FmdB family regulatory protein